MQQKSKSKNTKSKSSDFECIKMELHKNGVARSNDGMMATKKWWRTNGSVNEEIREWVTKGMKEAEQMKWESKTGSKWESRLKKVNEENRKGGGKTTKESEWTVNSLFMMNSILFCKSSIVRGLMLAMVLPVVWYAFRLSVFVFFPIRLAISMSVGGLW